MGLQLAFDLAQFDTETTDFHLLIGTPHILDQTIGAQAYQIPCAVQTTALLTERVGDEALSRQPRTIVIPLGKTGAPNVQLTDAALRQ